MSETLIDRERKLFEYAGPDRVVHFTEYLAIKGQEGQHRFKLMSGYTQFDEKLDGLVGGEVSVITGRTGEGKTLFTESYLRNMLVQTPEARAAIFSFEVTPQNLLAKHKAAPSTPFYLPLELKAMDVHWLSERIHEAQIKHGCQIFLLDHLHFLVDMATKQNMSLNIGGFMRHLVLLAKELDVAILLIAHQKGGTKGEEPGIEDIRDSTFIGQEAANVIVVWRREDFTAEELRDLRETNPTLHAAVSARIDLLRLPTPGSFQDGFAFVQIAKARRTGTYRWKKLFQKCGDFLEEV